MRSLFRITSLSVQDEPMMMLRKKVIALEARLRACKNVLTLGVRPNFSDYDPEAATLIRGAKKIYYPTRFYADLFDAMGKETFPGYHTYKCVQDKIRQTALLTLLNIPHPRTRVFYGKHQKTSICDHFRFPFIGKIPKGSAMGRGVFLIKNPAELSAYCSLPHPAYVQEYLPIRGDIRVVVIGSKVVHSYWRIPASNEFRSNVALGATIRLNSVPQSALDLALYTAKKCRWDDVGIDICRHDGKYYVLEANMKYGKEGFKTAGIDYIELMETLIEREEI